jgi:alginate O-acetyltransferase complex protein AlgI
MLFNSFEFFGFLPFTLIGFFVIGRRSPMWAMRWLILASLFFYGWWRPLNIVIILPLVLTNYALARVISNWVSNTGVRRRVDLMLYTGVIINLTFLGYFKYRNFFVETINDIIPTNLAQTQMVLPLGISFIIFQKIAFLYDVRGQRIKQFNFQDYATFVFFFPQLIAGPIVHYGEMVPQFHKPERRLDWNDLSIGATLFCMGLFKKLLLADSISPYLSGFYADAAAGNKVALLQAWLAGIGFTLQIYFDFSAYSDMAIGLARMFGVRLPANFNSPLKATSIIDFWTRWHMTLTRFLTSYLYNPMTLALTRRRAAKGLPGVAGRHTTFGSFVLVLMLPLLITMSLAGFWHGAGWNFVLFGALHGIYLTINHAWRLFRPRLSTVLFDYGRVAKPFSWVIVFGSIVVANVFFRSSSIPAALALLKGMLGLNGTTVPLIVFDCLSPLSEWLGLVPTNWNSFDFTITLFFIALLSLVAFALPNTLQILEKYEPALRFSRSPASGKGVLLSWHPSVPWAAGIALILAAALINLPAPVSFVYFNF